MTYNFPCYIINLISTISPKNIAVIAVLLGEVVDKGLEYKHLFEKLDLEEQKARRKSDDDTLFKKKEKL